jgi:ribose transport system ATP-binding protein
MVYISHNLGDVLRLSDDIAVLRDGEVVGQGPRADFTLERLVSIMVGRPLTQLYPRRAGKPSAEPLLRVRGVSQPGVVREVELTLHRGEILGLFGLMGSGRSELARIIFGLDPFALGEISVEGEPPRPPTPSRSLRRGVAFVTEDRRGDGLLLEASIAENIALVGLRDHVRGPLGWIASRPLSDAVRRISAAVRLSTRAFSDPVRTLSGGNQQKVVLGKWLLRRPRAIILDEPTRGIDVGAKHEIYSLVGELADRGTGVLFISSEIEELLGVADRILVMSEGEIRDEARAGDFDRERLLRAALRRGPGQSGAEEGGAGFRGSGQDALEASP